LAIVPSLLGAPTSSAIATPTSTLVALRGLSFVRFLVDSPVLTVFPGARCLYY
jgi:hypothetical protein